MSLLIKRVNMPRKLYHCVKFQQTAVEKFGV